MAGIDRVQTLKSIDEGTYYDGEQPEVGDVIECLPEEGSFPSLKEFEQYTVEEIDGGYVFFDGNGWWPARFCLISRGPSEGMKEMDATLNEDTLSRLRMMATDKGDTWDLSPKDQAAIQYALDQIDELKDVLRSARCIAERQGIDTAWVRFSERIGKLGIGSVTAKVFKVLPEDVSAE